VAELDTLFGEAADMGVLSILLTGGEPLLCPELPRLITQYPQLLFVVVTNGSLVTRDISRKLAQSGNVLALVSLEGGSFDTERRRGAGTHETARRALTMFRDADLLSGFSVTVGADNVDRLKDDEFIDEMIELGCAVGFYTEYVPCGVKAYPNMLLDRESREGFRRAVLGLMHRKHIVLIQFPHDEYGSDNLCSAAGRESVHINSRGDVEPCPFVPVARDNIRNGGLMAAFKSAFLREIRTNRDLLRRSRFACALFEHREELYTIAKKYDVPY
jgi:MoaA/NifB/PqqE/SkfB family radical SAM enzyme